MYVCMYVCMHACMYVMYACMNVMYVCMHVCMYAVPLNTLATKQYNEACSRKTEGRSRSITITLKIGD
jgi:hypothetical protein